MARSLNGQRLQRLKPVYASSPSNRAHCYADLAVSSPAVAETIVDNHFDPLKKGQAEWAELDVKQLFRFYYQRNMTSIVTQLNSLDHYVWKYVRGQPQVSSKTEDIAGFKQCC